jgi:Leucine-rich repeat (LRR) protein
MLLLCSSGIVAQGTVYNYTTDSLAVAAILTANGWGMPVVDSGWLVDCSVNSVSDTANGRIVQLMLPRTLLGLVHAANGGMASELSAELPAEIGNLTALTDLDIEANNIDSLPAEIGNLTNLIFLNAMGNELTALPTEIGNLTKLEKLFLSSNLLTELPPSIGNLTELRSIELDNNQLTQLPPEIGNWSNLEMFSGYRNPQLTTLPPEIGNLRKMWYLNLMNSGLVSLPNEIGACCSLTTLWVLSNNLTALPDSIVKLKCDAMFGGNLLCSSVPCPIQQWLTQYDRDRGFVRPIDILVSKA